MRDSKKPVVDDRRIGRLNQMPTRVRLIRVLADGSELNAETTGTEAWNQMVEAGLDLIMIAPQANPPVVRMCDYGKFKYAEERHAKEMAKANRANARTLKEIWINQTIGPADYERNLKRIRDWLPDHDVKLGVQMRGHRGRVNRLALPRGMPQEDAPKWPDFILNRLLKELGPEIKSDRISVGLHGITTLIRPA